jgi:hypothetical protein
VFENLVVIRLVKQFVPLWNPKANCRVHKTSSLVLNPEPEESNPHLCALFI